MLRDTLQVLVHATTESARAGERCLANKLGLPTLFGIFMGKNKTKGAKAGSGEARQQLESACTIIANLMHYTQKKCVFSVIVCLLPIRVQMTALHATEACCLQTCVHDHRKCMMHYIPTKRACG